MRLCLSSRGHRNPDGTMISGPHIHRYREGQDDKWAYPLPPQMAECCDNPTDILGRFMEYCNVTNYSQIQGGLF